MVRMNTSVQDTTTSFSALTQAQANRRNATIIAQQELVEAAPTLPPPTPQVTLPTVDGGGKETWPPSVVEGLQKVHKLS